jgi:hypothetical protein
MKKLIMYEGDGEVLVCNPSDEKRLLKEWFVEGKRGVEEYDRTEINGILEITSHIRIQTNEG